MNMLGSKESGPERAPTHIRVFIGNLTPPPHHAKVISLWTTNFDKTASHPKSMQTRINRFISPNVDLHS